MAARVHRTGRRPWPWRRVAGILALLAAAVVAYRLIDFAAVREAMEGADPWVVVAAATLLPLVGFPVTVLDVAVGVRFGAGGGLLVVAGATAFQLLASYALVARFHRAFAARLDPIRQRLPRAAHADVCWFTMLLPGVPYFAKNYVLPLVGVPLRPYLLVCFPVHVVRSVVSVVFGDQSDHLTPGRVVFLAAYYVATLGAAAWFFQRLRRQLSRAGAGHLRHA